ncbi:MAG TPA: alkaline phosphatase family protein [Acidimicrobiales bacterium]|nr:alkaline phosphatase family protein [Acidimicrobiales bacterium]
MAAPPSQPPRRAPRLDRRTFLAAALAAGGGGLLAAMGGGEGAGAATIRAATSVKPAGSDLGAIEHVIFLMQENRSFDHYYGTYPRVRGFDDHPAHSLGAFAQAWPGGAAEHLLPFHLAANSGIGECTYDLSHTWPAEHMSRGQGNNADFVRTHTSPAFEGPAHGVMTMGYYERQDLPFYYALADAFTICDNYHCSVMGPTHPNRLMALSGTIDPAGKAGGPVIITNQSVEAIWSATWDTMPEILEDAGISWKVYNPEGSIYAPPFFEQNGLVAGDAILPYFSQYKNPASPLYQKAFLPQYPSEFMADVANGTLPSVSWILPPAGYDEHPPSPPALGEWFTSQLLTTLVSNPEVWSKTVLFHMYDENDGFFDHVPPPTPPKGTPGEFLTARPLPTLAGGIRGPIGMGYRVPMLVVSPFSRGGHIASDVFDHTSQLRFLEARFGVRAPNLTAWRRRTAGDLTSTLHMQSKDVSAPVLPSTSNDLPANVMAEGCTEGDILEIDNNQPPYPIPMPQVMARQEPTRSA